jgi:hypothetical protein
MCDLPAGLLLEGAGLGPAVLVWGLKGIDRAVLDVDASYSKNIHGSLFQAIANHDNSKCTVQHLN